MFSARKDLKLFADAPMMILPPFGINGNDR
jgi:hypothetical protein